MISIDIYRYLSFLVGLSPKMKEYEDGPWAGHSPLLNDFSVNQENYGLSLASC